MHRHVICLAEEVRFRTAHWQSKTSRGCPIAIPQDSPQFPTLEHFRVPNVTGLVHCAEAMGLGYYIDARDSV
jgi:hypothetical protein